MPRDHGLARQSEIYLAGVRAHRPAVPVDPGRLEEAARRALSAEAFAYVAGGAGGERTIAANRAAFDRWCIVPRVLRDVGTRDTAVELLGRRIPAPILLAPVGVLEMAHPRAEREVCRAAAAEGVPLILSSQASVPMETCAGLLGPSPRWFQLYWSKTDDLARSFVRRAEAAGCEAIVVTLDTTMLGWRPRDLDLAYLPFLRGKGIAQYTSDPVFLQSLDHVELRPAGKVNLAALRTLVQMSRAFPGPFLPNLVSRRPRQAVQQFIAGYSRPTLTWDDLGRLRDWTRLPVLLKGILHPDDARRAADLGVDGIVVSNHGGRQVDGEVASLDALERIAGAVGSRIPLLVDGGIRGGADVFKALALGARAVCVGRPYVYGLAVAGEAGVTAVIRNLTAELDLTMGLAGCASVADITPDALTKAP